MTDGFVHSEAARPFALFTGREGVARPALSLLLCLVALLNSTASAAPAAPTSAEPARVVNELFAALATDDPEAVLKCFSPGPDEENRPRLLALIRGHQAYVKASGEVWLPVFTKVNENVACVVCVQPKLGASLPIAFFLVERPEGWRIVPSDYFTDPRLELDRKQTAAVKGLKDWLVENRDTIQKSMETQATSRPAASGASVPASSKPAPAGGKP